MALIERFEWVIYVFGAILIVSGVKMGLEKDKEIHPDQNPVLKLFRKLMPVTKEYEGGKFFVRRDGRTFATPLLLVLLVVETTDLIFAVDSIPAVLAITRDRFIVYTSNIFAILGLRALYFALKGAMDLFHHLHYGLSAILVFVGAKMIVSHYVHIPIGVALGVVGGVLALSVVASLIWPEKKTRLENQHAIAVTEEAIPLAHRFFVGPQDQFPRCKRAHQHQQRRARQVKIRQHHVHVPELEWRTNENVRCPFVRAQLFERLQRAHHRRAHRDNAARIADGINRLG